MYVETINPEVYPELNAVLDMFALHPNWCIAGGAGRNYLERLNRVSTESTEPDAVSDFDVFTFSSFTYYTLLAVLKTSGFEIRYTDNNWLIKAKKGDLKVDLIYNDEYDTPQLVIDSFDFRCCQVFITPDRIITASDKVVEDIYTKELNLVSVRRPYGILRRIQSYAQKGYLITESFAEGFVDAIRILEDEDLDLSFSYSNAESFNWENYDAANQVQDVLPLNPTPRPQWQLVDGSYAASLTPNLTAGDIINAIRSAANAISANVYENNRATSETEHTYVAYSPSFGTPTNGNLI